MTIAEKVAHLKGLMEGLNCDDKVLNAIVDILEDLAYDVEDVQDALAEVGEQVELIDEDLEALENDYYEFDDDCDCDCDCDCCDDDCDCCCDDEDLYEVECPACGEVICIDGCIVDEGEMDCPNCGEHLEFDLDEEEEDEE
ncbi:MAG: hypothetical protein IJA05_02755 [Oscillospiraceae bacterium]|nr:hypothetical protein [Oscillospiraceae bacterium]MBQ8594572.1 hypothetical protein [Oscillospiraceae bacterium]